MQFDSTVATLDAYADETAFRQELFSHVFSPNGTSAVHLVKVTALLSGDGIKGKWLDVDYITFTSGPCVFHPSNDFHLISSCLRFVLQRHYVLHWDCHFHAALGNRVRPF